MYGLYLLHKRDLAFQKIKDKLKEASNEMFRKLTELPQPFTDSKEEFNFKPRLVKCENCKYEVMTNIPGPKCGICHSYLIVVF